VVGVRRALEYSYLVERFDYIAAGVTVSVTQRLADAWDVGGNFGRARLTYLPQSTRASMGLLDFSPETYFTYGMDVGYNINRTRVGVYLDRRERQSDAPELFLGYRRFRIGSSVTYAF
jgi:hypothetical protein